MIVEHPMLFMPRLIHAIMAGRKTVTRRLLKVQTDHEIAHCCRGGAIDGVLFRGKDGESLRPRYAVGDEIWVKEQWVTEQHLDDIKPSSLVNYVGDQLSLWYEYTGMQRWYTPRDGMVDSPICPCKSVRGKKRSPMFMPKVFSNLRLKIVSLNIERVSDITESDAEREGVSKEQSVWEPGLTYRGGFLNVWNEIYEGRGYGVDKDPLVLRLSFERIER